MFEDIIDYVDGTKGARKALFSVLFFFFQAEDGIRDLTVTGVQTCALPISPPSAPPPGTPTRLRASASSGWARGAGARAPLAETTPRQSRPPAAPPARSRPEIGRAHV